MVVPQRDDATAERPPLARLVAMTAVAVCGIVATLVLVAWIAGMPRLAALGRPWTPMVAGTALVVLAQGAAVLALLQREGRWRTRTLVTSAVVVALLAGAVLVNYVVHWARGSFLYESGPAWRMAPSTAAAAVLGAASVAGALGRGWWRRAAEMLAGASLVIVTQTLVAFLLGASPLSDLMGRVNMSPVTGLCFVAASIGLIAAMPGGWVVTILADAGTGGRIARLLLPIAVVLPILLTSLQFEAERGGVFGHEYGAAMRTLVTIILLAIAILWLAHYVNRRDAERRRELALQTLLADASALLVTPVELEPTLAAVAGRCVPLLADRCSITLATAAAGSEDRQRAISLPLVARGGAVGTLSLVRSESRDGYDDTDLRVAQQLADRCAIAIDHARMFDAVQHELEQRQRAEGEHRKADAKVLGMEEQMRQAQKMEAIGRLAGGVAHDFNNILTTILATADLALEAPGLNQELRDDLVSIRESGQRAAAITRQLLLFSRKQVVQPRPVDLNEVVERIEPMLGRLLPAGITLSIQRRSRGVVEADPIHIEQVLLNLVVNAGDAMPDGGTVSITTEDMDVAAPTEHDGRTLPAGQYVVLRVRDMGVGMTDEVRSRIFEPFFTTKEPGRGTGLGLATVYGIVEEAHGHVFVQSRPGEGTQFEIVLPRVNAIPVATATRPAEQIGLGGSEAVLVVEDEAQVRAPMCRALRQLGYFVLEAKHGEDALTILQEYHAPVHLVITDAVMPEMGGAELVRLLHAWYPQLRVLFISGYSEELLKAQGSLSPNARYLAKPFTPRALALVVRALLDESPEAS